MSIEAPNRFAYGDEMPPLAILASEVIFDAGWFVIPLYLSFWKNLP
jgi:hypothetical protein